MMVAGFYHQGVMKSGAPGNAFRFSGHPQDARTDFNDSHSSDTHAKLHAIRARLMQYHIKVKGEAKASSSVSGKLIARGTATS